MNFEITGNETADQLIKQLVGLRICARRIVMARNAQNYNRAHWTRLSENAPDGATKAAALGELAELEERRLQLDSAEIEIGRYLMPLCHALDQKATRQQVFEAINANPADRDTEDVRKYGDSALNLICVMQLENSASTRGEDFSSREFQPLHWCHTKAFMRELKTNPKLDRIVHDGANEFFNGAFGEYRERPLMERLAGRSL
ncbi:hypothetical protein [Xenophilus sp. Marseille-Q4582]|uniref:hypothetical protein n=1 Tax=Xenophilus sp. Marseille-Q4582 TaxID=2866600 RepID=UPI001CE41D66|nr:hypothetical protein [Xenophilus sp. Marseille-Q4582]